MIIFKIYILVLTLVALKAFTIGSDFSFELWFKYRKEYTDWYFAVRDFLKYRKNKDKFIKEFMKFRELLYREEDYSE